MTYSAQGKLHKMQLQRSADGRTRDELKAALCVMFQQILGMNFDTEEFQQASIDFDNLRIALIDMGETHAGLNEMLVNQGSEKAMQS